MSIARKFLSAWSVGIGAALVSVTIASGCVAGETDDEVDVGVTESAVRASARFNYVLQPSTGVGYGTDFHWTINEFSDGSYDLGMHNDVKGKYTHFCVVYHCAAEGDHADSGAYMIPDHGNILLLKRNGTNCPEGSTAKGLIYVDNRPFTHCPV